MSVFGLTASKMVGPGQILPALTGLLIFTSSIFIYVPDVTKSCSSEEDMLFLCVLLLVTIQHHLARWQVLNGNK